MGIVIPKRKKGWEFDSASICGPLRPDQSMVSAISQEIALDAVRGPIIYLTPDAITGDNRVDNRGFQRF